MKIYLLYTILKIKTQDIYWKHVGFVISFDVSSGIASTFDVWNIITHISCYFWKVIYSFCRLSMWNKQKKMGNILGPINFPFDFIVKINSDELERFHRYLRYLDRAIARWLGPMASKIKDRGCKSLLNAKNFELDSLKEFTSSGGKLRYVSILTVYSHYGFLGNQINESLYM